MAIVRTLDSSGRHVVASSNKAKTADASAAEDQTVAARPEAMYAFVGMVVFAVGYAAGLWLLGHYHPGLTKLPKLAAGTSAFAVVYVLAQAVERVLVPVSWFGGGFLGAGTKATVKKNAQHALVAFANAQDSADVASKAAAAASAQHDVEQYRANLTATTFGVGGCLAALAAGYSGTLLLHVAGVSTSGWLDLLVTSLAIAGGSKPLHDLISNISSANKDKTTAS